MFGYVETNKAELLLPDDWKDDRDWFAICAPVKLFNNQTQEVTTKWVCTDGNIIALLNDKPGITHPVWTSTNIDAPYIFESTLFPYELYASDLGEQGDFSTVADTYFNILIAAMYLYETVQHDPDTWDWIITH